MTDRDNRPSRAHSSDDRGQGRGAPSDRRGRSDRDPRAGRDARPARDRDGRPPRDRDRGEQRRGGSANRPPEPPLPENVVPQDLDPAVRRDLLTLDRTNADTVARHLIMTSQLLEEDPLLALEHARAARQRAGRIAVVRETAGIAAYNAQEWTEALSELRAARRMSGGTSLLPLIADCERGLGRPDRAIDVARSDEGRTLTGDEAIEMKIVESGARIDLGEFDKAVVTLQSAGLDPGQSGTGPARLFYAYGTALQAAGREDDAITWFMNAAAADLDDVTDAELRLTELTDPERFAAEMAQEEAEFAEAAASPEPEPSPEPTRTPTPEPTPEPESTPEPAATPEPEPAPEPDPTPTAVEDTVAAPVVAAEPEPVTEIHDTAPQTPATTDEDTVNDAAPRPDGLADGYDALLFDLDGTLFAGSRPIDGATDALGAATQPIYFVTNNASRRAPEVAEHLTDLGFDADADQVVTSAQTAARLLAEHLEPGSRALVIGTDGLAQEIREVGIGVTRSADDRPAAVVQGHSTETGWAQLSEAVLAINAGALWIACNIDPTLPSERGFMLGNGSMVAAVANATQKTPLVAGKPAAPLMRDALDRSGASHPLVIGDRLDTDIAGANTIGADSLLVLTGVATVADAMCAAPDHRPTHIAPDLAALRAPVSASAIASASGWTVDVSASPITVGSTDGADADSLLPALLSAAWGSDTLADREPGDISFTATDDTASAALRRYGLDSDSVGSR
ncbi:HAD-IIA family hydrolase [Williamsia phyllosphaerae]|uniref:GCN5-related N-acetyltransferase-like domain-containing protein n=1 Tax=Williamsia phyllosphaerae TaxID=885042 RepID=A0ABQ1V986_9NOCA|nr:HAD-IIA family hydrolase [Williamsia phyllosphaerae]GGF44346.1 hypothetical protein GCM10007298_45120 [Williamsia phyllosphaerae]